jgi:hypothetical protein
MEPSYRPTTSRLLEWAKTSVLLSTQYGLWEASDREQKTTLRDHVQHGCKVARGS